MKRRSFFQLLFGGLLAKWLPKPAEPSTWGIAYKQIAPPDEGKWINLKRSHYPESLKVPVVGPPNVHAVQVRFVTKNGFITAPSPTLKYTAHDSDDHELHLRVASEWLKVHSQVGRALDPAADADLIDFLRRV